jgi:ribose transport system permease protein
MVVAQALVSGLPLLVAIALGAAVGVLIGSFNGFLVTVVRVDSVIVTLGMPMLIAGVLSWQWAGKAIVSGISPELAAISRPLVFGVPTSAVIAVFIALIVWYVVRHTPFGRYLHATGSNRAAAALVGIRPTRVIFTTFVLSGALAGLAGAVQVGVAGAANPNVGQNFTLPAIAAVFLSVAAISPGRFNVWGTCVAIVFLAVLNSGLTLAGASSYVNNLANGTALIVGVATAALLRRRSTK